MARTILFVLLGAVLAAACSSVSGPPAGPTIPPPPEVEGDTITTDSGLRYIEIAEGEGEPAVRGNEVRVSYTLWLEDGTGVDRGTIPQTGTFVLGSGSPNLIPGFTQGIVGMRQGGERRLIVPPELGYGSDGQGIIPPDATLIFDVELLERRSRPQ